MAQAKTDERPALAAEHAPKSTPPAMNVTPADIARRAYDLFLARGGEHGYDVDDWLHAEREMNHADRATVRS